MTEDGPRDYDDGYVERIGCNLRFRLAYSHEKGDITRFVVQLEYRRGGGWTPVVRYDHDPASKHGHDVSEEGLHIDVYRRGEKHRTDYVAPPMPAGVALDFAEDHLAENAERFVRRFEQWNRTE